MEEEVGYSYSQLLIVHELRASSLQEHSSRREGRGAFLTVGVSKHTHMLQQDSHIPSIFSKFLL